MTQGALHSAAVLFSILVAHEADGGAPLGEARLVRTTVTNRTRGYVSHFRQVVPFGVSRMAHQAVRGRLVV